MKKKEIKTEPQFEFDFNERQRFLILMKATVNNQVEVDKMFNMYKQYINPSAIYPIFNCRCNFSVAKYYEDLREWWSVNQHRFANE